MQTAPIPLGPFSLLAPVGHGGMARVWRGTHRRSGAEVAVKVLDGGLSYDERFLDAFASEIRAVAGLDHPGVVLVFDHGVVPEAAAARSDGALAEGAPYLVMEYAGGGTLLEHPPASWEALRTVLIAVLDALAHAHARGVVHRDIKGGNVLLCGGDDLRPGWKLSDFGLAIPVDGDAVDDIFAGSSVGTPPYMAPEQFSGSPRDFGPWTDLYALGCLTWLLTTGVTPFGSGTPAEIGERHCQHPLPPYQPHLALPTGFRDWLDRMLRKDSWARFQSAAEAAFALRSLDDSRAPARREAPAALPASQSTVLMDRSAPRAVLPSAIAPQPRRAEVPFPTDWRPPKARRDPIQLQGAGLGLLALRRTAVVGREGHRDRMWAALGRVVAGDGAECVLLHGEPGQGKSRLAQWLCERAAERGVARSVSAHWGPTRGAGEGLAGMLGRHLRLQGLDGLERTTRISRHLERIDGDPADLLALVAVVSPDDPAAQTVPPEQRFAALERLFEAETRRVPFVLWLDDLQHGPEGVALLEHLLARARPGGARLLVVGTTWTDALNRRDAVGGTLRKLLTFDRAGDLPVRPLSRTSQKRLLASLLSLEPSLEDEVHRKAEGNPLFAIQMLGDLAERGVLEPKPGGFGLLPGARASLPKDIHGLWQRRVERLVEPLGDGAQGALEVAAALGQRVDPGEWRAACSRAGVQPGRLDAELLDGGLAVAEEAAWVFSHGLLRESVERGARLAGRWERWNAACAEALAALPGHTGGVSLERQGRHWMEARRYGDALPPLLAAARARTRGDDCDAGLRVLDLADTALRKLKAPPADRRRGRVLAARADAELVRGEVQGAVAAARELSTLARERGWVELEGRALLVLGQVQLRQYRSAEAQLLLESALERLRARGEPVAVERAQRLLARALSHQRKHADARRYADEALRTAEASGDDARIGEAMGVQSALCRDLKQRGAAEEWTQRAAEAFVRSGLHVLVADAYSSLAEARRERGDLTEARVWFERARDQWKRVGSRHEAMGELCVAGVDMELGRPASGLEIVRRVLPTVQLGGYYESVCWILLLQGATLLNDWSDLPWILDTLERLQKMRQLSNPEYREVLDAAREATRRAGRPDDSARLAALADAMGAS